MKYFILVFSMFTFSLVACDSGGSENNMNDSTTNPVEHAENRNDNLPDSADDDADEMVDAAHSGLMEIAMAQHALKQAQSAEVRKVAQTILDDHKQMNTDLKALAAKKNITLPEALPKKEQDDIDKNDKKGKEYDKSYLDDVIKMHEKDIDEIKDAAEDSKDGDVKKLFGDAIPKLQRHLDMAKAAREKITQ